jgi:hypothetical protein
LAVPTLFSSLHLNSIKYSSSGIQYFQNLHQYLNNDPNIGDDQFLAVVDCCCGKFRNIFSIHRRIAAASFQTLAVLAANNEETRRVISDKPLLLTSLIEAIDEQKQLKSTFKDEDVDFDTDDESVLHINGNYIYFKLLFLCL